MIPRFKLIGIFRLTFAVSSICLKTELSCRLGSLGSEGTGEGDSGDEKAGVKGWAWTERRLWGEETTVSWLL